ncbi:tetratricopeptide repeat protein [Nonomuraea sp. KM90]|uniref:tetratricopeptide repeat protein n=1 Tax=Nonomuraea sp. KM90 TaxID=3457428 RepID=UPI003FCC427C
MNNAKKALIMARNYAELGRWKEALDALAPALASEETAHDALCLRAVCLLNGDSVFPQEKRALETVESALGLDPYSARAHCLRAHILLWLGRTGAALKAATEAARLDPDGVPTLTMLSRCQIKACRADDAWRTAQAAVEADPHDPAAYLALARAARARRDLQEAERAYRAGLRLDPHHEDLVLGLADLLYVDSRQWEAAEAYLAAARINPRSGTLPKALGEVWFLLRTSREGWQRNPRPMDAPQVERIDELLAASSPRIEAAVRELLVAIVEVRTEVDEALEQALNILGTLAESVGAHLFDYPAPGKMMPAFDHPMPELIPPEKNWHILGMKADPLPGSSYHVNLAAAGLRYDAERTAEYGEQFGTAATTGTDLLLEDGDGHNFHEILRVIHARTTRLDAAYRACADALSAFSGSLQAAQDQVEAALRWAEDAVRQLEYAQEKEEWEKERHQAIDAAIDAVACYEEAEARCVQAVRETLRQLRAG